MVRVLQSTTLGVFATKLRTSARFDRRAPRVFGRCSESNSSNLSH